MSEKKTVTIVCDRCGRVETRAEAGGVAYVMRGVTMQIDTGVEP